MVFGLFAIRVLYKLIMFQFVSPTVQAPVVQSVSPIVPAVIRPIPLPSPAIKFVHPVFRHPKFDVIKFAHPTLKK